MIVLDSSFLIGYYNPRDALHASAARAMVQFAGGAWGGGILLEYVFLEVVTVLRARAGLAAAVDAGRATLNSREVEFLPCSDIFLDVWTLFQQQQGRSTLSLADAAVAHTARRRAEGRVLTFDTGFRDLPGITVLPS